MLFKPGRQFDLFLSFFLFALLFEPLFSLFSLIFLLLSLSFFLFGWICRVADPIDAPSCNGPDPDPGRDGSSLSSSQLPDKQHPRRRRPSECLFFSAQSFGNVDGSWHNNPSFLSPPYCGSGRTPLSCLLPRSSLTVSLGRQPGARSSSIHAAQSPSFCHWVWATQRGGGGEGRHRTFLMRGFEVPEGNEAPACMNYDRETATGSGMRRR